MDACSPGGILIENIDNTGNFVFTNIKSETNTPDSGVTMLQEYTIIFNNCDRCSVVINGIHSQVDDDTVAPKDMIRIVGAGAPSIVWNASAARVTTSATDAAVSYVLNDTVTGKTVHVKNRHGRYNTLPVERIAISDISLAAGVGQTIQIPLKANSYATLGTPILASLTKDAAGLSIGQGYMVIDEFCEIRLQNFTASTINITGVNAKLLPVPNEYIKARASITWDPALQAAGAISTVNVGVPCSLGDFVIFTHGVDLQDNIATSYVTSSNLATVQLLNGRVDSVNVASATLTVYVMNDSAFSYLNTISYPGATIADGSADVVTLSLPGAVRGDFILASLNTDLQNLTMTAYVHAAGFATVRIQNKTGGPVTLPASTLRVGSLNTDG